VDKVKLVSDKVKDFYNKYPFSGFDLNKKNIEFIDLAENIDKDLDNFYDDGHFTKKGARKISEIISNYLKNRLP